MKLGETFEKDGATWIVWRQMPDGRQYAARIPDGQSVQTMGRSWSADQQPQVEIHAESAQ